MAANSFAQMVRLDHTEVLPIEIETTGSPPDGKTLALVPAVPAAPSEAAVVVPHVSVEDQLNDTGNAELLIKRHGEDFRYVMEWKSFIIWDRHRWVHDRGRSRMHEFATEAVRQSWKELYAHLVDQGWTDEADKVAKWSTRSRDNAKLEALLKVASRDARVAISAEDLDRDHWFLGVKNGVVELRNGDFREGLLDDFLTRRIGTEFDAEAKCPRWERFLEEVLEGDKETIHYVQKLAGYCLTGDTREQRFFFLYGYGANGKSTFLNVLQALLGKRSDGYATTMEVHALMSRTRSGHSATPEVAKLQGKRLVVAHEIPEGERLDESLVKVLTGGDSVTARELYASPVEFQPTHKLLIAGNHKPHVRGTGIGIWRRIDLIGFNRVFRPEEQDKDLEKKLLDELPGILNWAIDGCRLWQKEGLTAPKAVADATAEYRSEQDLLNQWMDERCDITDPTAWTPLKVLFHDYREWAKDANEWEMKQRVFSQKLEEKGFAKTRRSGGYGFDGIRLQGSAPLGAAAAFGIS